MNDFQTDNFPLQKLRLPQVTPNQGRTTLRHFLAPSPSVPPETPLHNVSPSWSQEVSSRTSGQLEPAQRLVPSSTSSSGLKFTGPVRIPRMFRREVSAREWLLSAVMVLSLVIILLVLIYYMTIF